MTQIVITTTQTWTVPSDWNNAANTIEVWGASAGGAANNNSANTGAGGGAAYSKKNNLTLSIGAGITAHIGAAGAGETAAANATAGGDSWFNGTAVVGSSCGAKGGAIGSGTTGGAGGAAASGVGDLTKSGGKGGNGNADGSGGGGGGAGGPDGDGVAGTAAAAGSTANGSSGGAGDAGSGGAGGTGAGTVGSKNGANGTANQSGGGGGQGGYSNEGNGGNGAAPGGGGGSAGNNLGTHLGGAGAAGQIVITYTPASTNPLTEWLAVFPDKQIPLVVANYPKGFFSVDIGVFNAETINLDKWLPLFLEKTIPFIRRNTGSTSLIFTVVTPEVITLNKWKPHFVDQVRQLKQNFPKGKESYLLPIPTPTPPVVSTWLATFPASSYAAIKNYLSRVSNTAQNSGGTFVSSTGPLRFIFSGNSQTVGSVQPYNDGIINVPLITVGSQFPIVRACIVILADAGKLARPYKMQIIRNGKVLFTLRSVIWGTLMGTGTDPMYQIVDQQLQATDDPLL